MDLFKRTGCPSKDVILVLVRLPTPQAAKFDAWIAKQREPLSRPEAIRRLVERGLRAKGK
jgi:hypothetical protein